VHEIAQAEVSDILVQVTRCEVTLRRLPANRRRDRRKATNPRLIAAPPATVTCPWEVDCRT